MEDVIETKISSDKLLDYILNHAADWYNYKWR